MEYFQTFFFQILLEFLLIDHYCHLNVCFFSRCQLDLFVILFKVQIVDLIAGDLIPASSFFCQFQILFCFFRILFYNICYQFCPFRQIHVIWHLYTDGIVLLPSCVDTIFHFFFCLFLGIGLLFGCLRTALALLLCWSLRWCLCSRSWRFCRGFRGRSLRWCFCSRGWCLRWRFCRSLCGWCLGRGFRGRSLRWRFLCLCSNLLCLRSLFLCQTCHTDI